MNDIYQQLAGQLAQRAQQGQGNPYASLMQQRQSPMGQGGGGQNPYANIFQSLGQQARMAPTSPQYGSIQMPTTYGQGAPQQQRLPGSPARPIPGYTTPGIDQRNPYPSTTPQSTADSAMWQNGMNHQAFQVANPYYGQTGYYGDLAQVQAQMAGKAQSSGIPTGVLGASTYTQNPAGQTPWVPDLTPQQKVDQDLASWEATRWG